MSRLLAEIFRSLVSVVNKNLLVTAWSGFKSRVKACDNSGLSKVGGFRRRFHGTSSCHLGEMTHQFPSILTSTNFTGHIRPSKRFTNSHVVRYLAPLCGRHFVIHQFLKDLMLGGNPNIKQPDSVANNVQALP